MPSLFRLLTVLGLLGGSGYAGLYALALFFEPEPREITKTVHATVRGPATQIAPVAGPAPQPIETSKEATRTDGKVSLTKGKSKRHNRQ
jgi:hypothetical protein